MKNGLKRKIINSHIGLSMALLIFIAVLFVLLASFVTNRQAKLSLMNDAKTLKEIVSQVLVENPDLSDVSSKLLFRQELISRFGSSSLENRFAILTKDFGLLYPRKVDDTTLANAIIPSISTQLSITEIQNRIIIVNSGRTKYMVAVIPPKSSQVKTFRNWVVLYTPITSITKQLATISLVLLLSLVISLILAAILGSIIGSSIAKPILELRFRAQAMAKRDFSTLSSIKTGDEIESLSDSINEMAKAIEDYDKAQKVFLQNASHELKTPLTSIQGYAEGIKDGVLKDKEKALDIIIEESVRLKNLVDELIFLSKLDTTEEHFIFSKNSMNDTLSATCDKLEGLASSLSKNLELNLSEDFTLYIDKPKIQQALINVIGNSLKFSKSKVMVTGAKSKDSCIITVSDDGDGIETSQLTEVFKRFSKGRKGDTGLGLSIAHLIIEKHKGTIDASNNENGGALFTIRLPITFS